MIIICFNRIFIFHVILRSICLFDFIRNHFFCFCNYEHYKYLLKFDNRIHVNLQNHYEDNVSGHLRNERDSKKKDNNESVKTKKRRLISLFHFIQTKRRRSISLIHFNQTKRRRSISPFHFVQSKRRRSIYLIHFIQTKKRPSISPFHFIQTKRRRSKSQSLLFISIRQKQVGQFFVKKTSLKKIMFKRFILIIIEDGQSLLFILFKQKGYYFVTCEISDVTMSNTCINLICTN